MPPWTVSEVQAWSSGINSTSGISQLETLWRLSTSLRLLSISLPFSTSLAKVYWTLWVSNSARSRSAPKISLRFFAVRALSYSCNLTSPAMNCFYPISSRKELLCSAKSNLSGMSTCYAMCTLRDSITWLFSLTSASVISMRSAWNSFQREFCASQASVRAFGRAD